VKSGFVFPTLPASRVEPVLYLQTGNMLEISQIARQQRGAVYQGNIGDLEVHGSNANMLLPESRERIGGTLIKRQDMPIGKQSNSPISRS
jgi:hypothetical protein